MDGSEKLEGGETHVVLQVLDVTLLGIMLGTLVRFAETQLLPIAPPYCLSVYLVGVLTSAIRDTANRQGAEGQLCVSAIANAQLVDPEVILLVLLPPLIYMSVVDMRWYTILVHVCSRLSTRANLPTCPIRSVFRRVSGQALLLAFPGALLQAFLVASFFRYAMSYGKADGGLWDWNVALCFGSIVTTTDPIAVVSALRELGAPEKLADLIDGEALLNDGSAFVISLIFLENVHSKSKGEDPHTFASGTAFFFQLTLGGFALGALAFAFVASCLAYVENDWRVEVAVILASVFSTFAIAEHLHVSGVLAVVTLGLLMSCRGKYSLSPAATDSADWVLPMVAHIAETLYFSWLALQPGARSRRMNNLFSTHTRWCSGTCYSSCAA
ncbi:Sodium/hydrogen exchanger family-domain-containing protein [Pavlovales sp. CCMP2436]|nr:Sodium/hydrogen exchanger family-domain-containing protein [Pavlovales sp. CCMP2436]